MFIVECVHVIWKIAASMVVCVKGVNFKHGGGGNGVHSSAILRAVPMNRSWWSKVKHPVKTVLVRACYIWIISTIFVIHTFAQEIKKLTMNDHKPLILQFVPLSLCPRRVPISS